MNPQLLHAIIQILALVGGIVLFVLDKPDEALVLMGAANLIAATSASRGVASGSVGSGGS